MRVIGLLLAIALVVVVAREIGDDDGREDPPGDAMPTLAGARLPPELRGVFAGIDDAARSALPDVLTGAGDDDAPAAEPVAPPFADAGRPARVAAVRRAVRRDLRSGEPRARVLAWQGVVVQGDRAVVRADVQARERTATGRTVTRPPQRVTFGLRRDDGWRIVTGE